MRNAALLKTVKVLVSLNMKPARVYALTHDISGARYVGSTQGPVFKRIHSHLAQLNAGTHTSKKFQRLWNDSTVCDWSFKVLEILQVGSARNRLMAEKAWTEKVLEDLRLNSNTRFASYERYDEVVRRIKRGEKYKDIAKAVGLSIGMISNIKNQRMKDFLEV